MCALVMMLVTYLVRAIPFTVFRRKVRNRFFRSFLYYVPYAVLTAMTLPAALYATGSMAVAAVGPTLLKIHFSIFFTIFFKMKHR